MGFRYFAQERARAEGLSGFVRNLPDGGVEAVAEGDADAVLRFERAIRHGPSLARIDDVQTELLAPAGFTTFSIRS